MKQTAFSILALLLSILSFGQAQRELPSFSQVSAQEGIDVFLSKGDSETARIEAEGIALDRVLTEVDGGTLKIHLEGDNHRNVDVKVFVTYVNLDGLKASSAASLKVDGQVNTKGNFDISCSSAGSIEASVNADEVDIDVSSSGDVNLILQAGNLDIEVSSAGEVNVSGKVGGIDAGASSSGEIDGYELICGDADLRASSGASIKLTVNGRLEARASSGASIRYQGSPTNTNTDSSSGGSVKRS